MSDQLNDETLFVYSESTARVPSKTEDLGILESKAATSSGLANRTKALEDRSVGAAFRTAIEERISALEEGSGPVKSQSTNPFEVIEDFKRKLSASGFRGTLTLEIS